jgi:two-component system, repressor protein LuxO
MGASPPNRVLIVEDSASLAGLYEQHLASEGFATARAGSAQSAIASLREHTFAALLLDLGLPDGDGMGVLKQARRLHPGLAIIVVTGNASINKAVESVREGAFEYLVKPVTRDKLVSAFRSSLANRATKPVSQVSRDSAAEPAGFVGNSPAMAALYQVIASVARSRAPAFITGESGTGKELSAEAIHRLSARSTGPFIALNCGAIPKDLMESEIFGHVKGSFTGAIADRAGAAKLAHGGTLFLDEICELDLSLQPKLLRFLQTGTIQPVGATVAEQVDVRIVCATNRDPAADVRSGRFREDLYYRLHVLPVQVPPLRARGRDIVALAAHFLETTAREEGKAFSGLSPDAEAELMANEWPGNVRQLQNTIRQAVVLHDGELLGAQMLRRLGGNAPRQVELDIAGLASGAARELWRIERDAIEGMIVNCGGSIPKAARLLGVSPSTIYRKRESWAAAAGM